VEKHQQYHAECGRLLHVCRHCRLRQLCGLHHGRREIHCYKSHMEYPHCPHRQRYEHQRQYYSDIGQRADVFLPAGRQHRPNLRCSRLVCGDGHHTDLLLALTQPELRYLYLHPRRYQPQHFRRFGQAEHNYGQRQGDGGHRAGGCDPYKILHHRQQRYSGAARRGKGYAGGRRHPVSEHHMDRSRYL